MNLNKVKTTASALSGNRANRRRTRTPGQSPSRAS